MKKITILGSGLVGCLLAVFLAKRDYQVVVVDSREDLRVKPPTKGRSINLALSCRGITSLKAAGIMNKVAGIIVPMRARAIYESNGNIIYQPFGRHKDEYINSIKRDELNSILLDELDTYKNVTVHFNHYIEDIDFDKKTLYAKEKKFNYEQLLAADGASSIVRTKLSKIGHINSSRKFLPHGYKELHLSQKEALNLRSEHLHLWPRGSSLLLGNPNKDGSITGSLFMPLKGINSFASLNSKKLVEDFFKVHFEAVFDKMPNLAEEFLENPLGNLSTVKCDKWHYRDSCLMVGDAAHGVVPFFGQGMNCGFEDCLVLIKLLDEHKDDWPKTIVKFCDLRKENTDAIAQMSMDNYYEITRNINNKAFNLKKELALKIMQRYPDRLITKHVMVMFSNIPYAQALALDGLQNDLLNDCCHEIDDLSQVDWHHVKVLLDNYDKKLTQV